MGKLAKLRKLIPTREVEIGGETLTLRGLSFADLSQLARNHLSELKPLFEAAKATGGDEEAVNNLLIQAVAVAPGAVAEAIALALDAEDEEDFETISELPAVYQTTLLAEIVAATMIGGVALEKMVGALSEAMGLLFAPAAGQTTPPKASKGGSSASEKKSRSSGKKATRKPRSTR